MRSSDVRWISPSVNSMLLQSVFKSSLSFSCEQESRQGRVRPSFEYLIYAFYNHSLLQIISLPSGQRGRGGLLVNATHHIFGLTSQKDNKLLTIGPTSSSMALPYARCQSSEKNYYNHYMNDVGKVTGTCLFVHITADILGLLLHPLLAKDQSKLA